MISAGYGKLKDTSFRIAHMGDVSEADLKKLLVEMDRILKTM
jgi:aspartate aminotransferase-like enzyme